MRLAPRPVFPRPVFPLRATALAVGLLLCLPAAQADDLPLPRARMDAGVGLTAEALVAAAARVPKADRTGPGDAARPFAATAATAAARPSIFQRLAAANDRAREASRARQQDRLLQRASAPGALGRLVTVPGPDGEPVALGRTSCGAAESFVAAFVKVEPVDGKGGCGIKNPIRVSALTTSAVQVTPSATLNCAVTKATADWMREAVLAAAERELGSRPARIVNASSYACRSRGHRGGRLSEHAFGNALDIRAFVLEDGRRIDVQHHPKGSPEARFLASVRASACQYFTTVLGPGFNRAHADHLHLDIARHTPSGDYRFCR